MKTAVVLFCVLNLFIFCVSPTHLDTEVKIFRHKTKTCTYCKGTGYGQTICSNCQGSGHVRGRRCNSCNGWGFEKCMLCGGSGKINGNSEYR